MGRVKNDDNDLVRQLKRGSESALEILLQRYAAKVYSLASRLTRNHLDAEEVLQDVFHTVFIKIKRFEGKSSFSSWLYRITVNSSLMKLRKRRQDKSALMEDVLPDFKNDIRLKGSAEVEGDVALQQHQVREALELAVRKLPDDYRPVFVLRDIDGLTSREVGKILRLTVPAVKSRLHRSRLMLRKELLSFYQSYSRGTERTGRWKAVGNM